jgi:hypothetical protein
MSGSTTLERNIQSEILKWCHRKTWIWIVKYPGGTFGLTGCPDLILSVNGMFLALEVKREGKEPTDAQVRQGELIRRAGGMWVVVRSLDDAIEAIGEAVKKGVAG